MHAEGGRALGGGRAGRGGAANGGVLSTAGGLVFPGTGTGEFVALAARSGAALWSALTQTGASSAPIAYQTAGVQYVTGPAGTAR